MNIPLSSPWVTDADREAVMAVLSTKHLALGPVLKEFEDFCASLAGVKHAVAMSSGTAALCMMNHSIGLTKGDEVLTPSFSFVASANSILHAGAKPIFVDIDADSWNMSPKLSAEQINNKSKAIQMVDIFGLAADGKSFEDLAAKHHLELLEDACEAVGAKHADGRMAGSLGKAGAWAFYPNKQFTTGEGGVLLTDDEALAEDCRSLMNQGRDPTGQWFGHKQLGWNHRLSDINAALGLSQLKRLDQVLAMRKNVARLYSQGLKDLDEVSLMPDMNRSWFVYVIRCRETDQRDALAEHLKQKNIGCGKYFVPIHLMPFIQESCGTKKGQLPETEKLAAATLAIPFFSQMSEDQVSQVCDAVKDFF